MKVAFKQLIVDFHKRSLPVLIRRDVTLPEIPGELRKAIVLIGARRSGKTFTMYQEILSRQRANITKEKDIYINFADDRLIDTRVQDLQSLLDAYHELYSHNIDDPQVTLYLDEIHEVTGWESFIRRILDQENYRIIISGSSAKLLSKEIATQLRGRSLSREIFPFSFAEYLRASDIELREVLSTKEQSIVIHHQEQFLRFGGFPETFRLDPILHRELLQTHIELIIYRDIIERHRLQYNPVLRELLTYCIRNSASLLSINTLYTRYKSLGRRISKDSLYEYMGYFEDCFGIFSIPIYTFSTHKQQINPKKIYAIDQGLMYACTIKPDFDLAAALETAVFLQLRRYTERIYYYKTSSGKEIDFLVESRDGVLFLFQVCRSLKNPGTANREVSALMEASRELETDRRYIITIDETGMSGLESTEAHQVEFHIWIATFEFASL